MNSGVEVGQVHKRVVVSLEYVVWNLALLEIRPVEKVLQREHCLQGQIVIVLHHGNLGGDPSIFFGLLKK